MRLGYPYISPYNDVEVRLESLHLRCATMALHMGVPCVLTDLNYEPFKLMVWQMQVAGGQGTIALELLSQLPAHELDAVFVPVGGGGLISGTDQCALTAVSQRLPVI